MTHEQALLGGIIVSRGSYYHELSVERRHLESDSSRRIWDAIHALIAEDAEPDLMAVADRAEGVDASRISEITTDAVPSNWRYYEQAVIDRYRSRKLNELGQVLQSSGDVGDRIRQAEELLTELQQESESDRVYHRAETIGDFLELTEARYKARGDLPGYPSGIAEIDSYTLGWQDRRLYYVGARPSGGKSALLLQFADYLAMQRSIPVGVISLESSRTELLQRSVSRDGNIESSALSTGHFAPAAFESIRDVCSRVYDAPMWIYDAPNAEVSRVASVARQMVRQHGVQCLFVDYVQLIRVQGAQSRREQVEAASLELKALARSLDVPVIAAAQLRRDVDQRIPGMGDFQHSSQLEQDADGVILLHDEEHDGEYSQTHAQIAKNRDGKKGRVSLWFDGAHVRFAPVEVS